jgi:KRAB domain-containing zinc finger protein
MKERNHSNVAFVIIVVLCSLKRHVLSVHEGKKPFKCNICDATFAKNSNMKNHFSAVHEGKKPFKCIICDATFSENRNMKNHFSEVHEGKKR